ncbi:DUF2169 family type VI secretion system accessory protein [Polyangium aurulentum]|uniref:DUF2169 family type VI secretion system accessory protein n=1 Tax=Polyangium aurulentum TaxID=2567896 RepID=UPI0010AEC1F5|nr:DUF2169 domain-containing protein [Polyangium aurulentum]UQA56215.1 DUF2169 domain-containing protein [Polyangium aurulentum]
MQPSAKSFPSGPRSAFEAPAAGDRSPVRVTARGPFDVGSLLWRDELGTLVCTVIAKATYKLAPGESAPLDVPLPLQEEDGHWDDDPTKSVHVPSDLVPFKRSAEIVVVGSAFAPEGRATRSVAARVVVGSVDKTLEAWGPRRFRVDGTLQDAPPQARFSLRYEHAPGGPDTDNPAGIDASRPGLHGQINVPQLLPHLHQVHSPSDHIPRVGFGPIAAVWPSRAGLLGPRERAWLGRPGASPMPQTFPSKFFQVAPEDQWLDRPLAPNELIVLEKMHAKHPRLAMSLSGLEPRAIVVGSNEEPLWLQADLLFIDTDRGLVTLTYRGQRALTDDARDVHVIVVGAPMGAVLSPEEVQRLVQTAGEDVEMVATADDGSEFAIEAEVDDDGTATMAGTVPYIADRPALPFFREQPPPPPMRASIPDGALPFRDALTQDAAQKGAPVRAPAPPPPVPAPPPPVPSISTTLASPPAPPPPVPAHVRPPMASVAIDAGWDSPRPAPPPTIGQQQAAATPAEPPPPPKPAATSVGPKSFEAAFGASKAASFDAGFGGAKPAAKPVESSEGAKTEPRTAPSASAAPAGREGGFVSAKAASDAAAHEERRRDVAKESTLREATGRPALQRLAVVDLLHFEPKALPRIRSIKRFAQVLSAMARPRTAQSVDLVRVEPPQEEQDRSDFLRLLSCTPPVDAPEIRRALADSLDDLVDFHPPLVIVAGELRPLFDELETLRTTVSVAQPVAGGDKRLLAAIAVAQEAIAAPIPPRADTVLGLARNIESASASLSLPPRYVASEVERLLLEGRKYKRRPLLGAPRIRADLTLTRSGEVMVVYLPDSIATSLPLLPAYPVTALVEARPREDIAESHAEALLAMAVGRVLHGRSEGHG